MRDGENILKIGWIIYHFKKSEQCEDRKWY